MKRIIPSFMTVLNAFSGIIAIYLILMFSSLYLIFDFISVGLIFDGLDGYLARRLHVDNKWGIILDSTADTITFSIAPSLLLYISLYSPSKISFSSPYNSLVVVTVYFLFIMGFYRLIRYARETIKEVGDKRYFFGYPAPANALFVLSSFIILNRYFLCDDLIKVIYLLVVLSLSVIMISRIKYPKPGILSKIIILITIIIFIYVPTSKKIFIVWIFLILSIFYLFSPLYDRIKWMRCFRLLLSPR